MTNMMAMQVVINGIVLVVCALRPIVAQTNLIGAVGRGNGQGGVTD